MNCNIFMTIDVTNEQEAQDLVNTLKSEYKGSISANITKPVKPTE